MMIFPRKGETLIQLHERTRDDRTKFVTESVESVALCDTVSRYGRFQSISVHASNSYTRRLDRLLAEAKTKLASVQKEIERVRSLGKPNMLSALTSPVLVLPQSPKGTWSR